MAAARMLCAMNGSPLDGATACYYTPAGSAACIVELAPADFVLVEVDAAGHVTKSAIAPQWEG